MINHSEQALYKVALHWIKNMLLLDEIRLKDIPQEIRVSSSGVYVTAFRISNGVSCKRFVKDLQVLCHDIYMLDSDEPQRAVLVRTLADYLAINDHKKEDEFIDFQETIYEEVLCELQRSSESAQNALRQQFEKIGIG